MNTPNSKSLTIWQWNHKVSKIFQVRFPLKMFSTNLKNNFQLRIFKVWILILFFYDTLFFCNQFFRDYFFFYDSFFVRLSFMIGYFATEKKLFFRQLFFCTSFESPFSVLLMHLNLLCNPHFFLLVSHVIPCIFWCNRGSHEGTPLDL